MKQSIFILVALWGLIGTFIPTEEAQSQNVRVPVQTEQTAEMR